MKSLLSKLTFALLTAILISLIANQEGVAFKLVSLSSRQKDLPELSMGKDEFVSSLIPQLKISTPPYPVGMDSKESKFIQHNFTETGNGSGQITSFTYQFYTQYGVALSDPIGPYPTSILINPMQSSTWNQLVYLPESVVDTSRKMEEYAIVLKTEFDGKTVLGKDFSAESSLLLLLPPAAFSKISPADGAIGLSSTQTLLQWDSSVGASDYEYCVDTIDNDSCDVEWIGTYDTNVLLHDLPPATTFYWQVRANNMAGKTSANYGVWWSFKTGGTCLRDSVTVKNINNFGPESLRQALSEVCPGGTIIFDPSLSGQTITLSSKLVVQKDLHIDGSSLASKISISGNRRVTVIDVPAGITVYLDSLIIKDGYSRTDGGGIYNSGSLIVTNCSFIYNSAYHFGGGIYNSETISSTGTGGLSLSNSTFQNNSASIGGGIFH